MNFSQKLLGLASAPRQINLRRRWTSSGANLGVRTRISNQKCELLSVSAALWRLHRTLVSGASREGL